MNKKEAIEWPIGAALGIGIVLLYGSLAVPEAKGVTTVEIGLMTIGLAMLAAWGIGRMRHG